MYREFATNQWMELDKETEVLHIHKDAAYVETTGIEATDNPTQSDMMDKYKNASIQNYERGNINKIIGYNFK